MKTVFNINNKHSKVASSGRIIEISEAQLAFIYYSISPREIQQLKIFSFDKNEGFKMLAAQLKECFKSEISEKAEIKETDIFFNTKELTLVPDNLHSAENNEDLLNFIFGEEGNIELFNERINNTEIFLVYRLSKDIVAAVGEFFPGSNIKHSISKQFKIPENSSACIYCSVGYSYAKIFVFNNHQLLLQRYFPYATADDMAYELLNSCAQLNIDVAEVQLNLSGFIEANSNLYSSLHKYFLNIEFENIAENLQIISETETYPAHLFYPLFQLLPNENN